MSTGSPIESILRQIADLLSKHNELEWAIALERFADEYIDSPEQTKRYVRSIYGGMGSFNDIILHGPNGIPLVSENDELDRLRSEPIHDVPNLVKKAESQENVRPGQA